MRHIYLCFFYDVFFCVCFTKISRSLRAGLVFPVTRLKGLIKKDNYASKMYTGAAIYLVAVLEYLSCEISGKFAQQNHRSRICPRHIMHAIRTDEELDLVLGGNKRHIAQAGAICTQ